MYDENNMRLINQEDFMEARFGRYGGQYVPETVMPALKETEAAYEEANLAVGVARQGVQLFSTRLRI